MSIPVRPARFNRRCLVAARRSVAREPRRTGGRLSLRRNGRPTYSRRTGLAGGAV